jgi:hypothetical protein
MAGYEGFDWDKHGGGMQLLQPSLAPQDFTPTPQDPSGLETVIHRGIGAALPIAGSIEGAGLGGALGATLVGAGEGAVGGLPGVLIGGALGLGGALAGGYAANKAQTALLDTMPTVRHALGQDPEQIAAEEQAHPILSMVGELLPQAAALQPTNLLSKGLPLAQRVASGVGAAIGGAIQGGQEAYSEYQADQSFDPLRIGLATGAGALFSGHSRIPTIGGDIVSGRAPGASEAPPGPEPPPAPAPPPAPPTSDNMFPGADLGAPPDRVGPPLPMREAPFQAQRDLLQLGPTDNMEDALANVRQVRQQLQSQVTAAADAKDTQAFYQAQDALQRFNDKYASLQPVQEHYDRINAAAADQQPKLGAGPQQPPFSASDVLVKLRNSTQGMGEPSAADADFTTQVALQVAKHLAADDVDGAHAFLDQAANHVETTDKISGPESTRQLAVVDAAKTVVDDYFTTPKPAAAEVTRAPVAEAAQEAAPAAPAAPQPSPDFSVGSIFKDISGGVGGSSDRPFALKLASQLATHLRNGDVEGARDLVRRGVQEVTDAHKFMVDHLPPDQVKDAVKRTVDPRTAVMAAAHDVVDSYVNQPPPVEGEFKQAVSRPPAEPAAPAKPAGANVTALPADLAAMHPDEVAARQQLGTERHAAAAREQIAQQRSDILHSVLVPETHNPTGRFIAELRRAGHDTSITPEEARSIGRYEDVRHAFDQMQAERAPPPAESREEMLQRVLQDGRVQNPEQVLQMRLRKAGLDTKLSPDERARLRPLELSRYSEADIARREGEQQRREAAAGREPEPPPGPENRTLFDEQGRPSPESGALQREVNAATETALAPEPPPRRTRGKMSAQATEPADVSRETGEPGQAKVPEGVPTREDVPSPRTRAGQMMDAKQISPEQAGAIQKGIKNGAPFEALHDQLDSMAAENLAPKARAGTTEGFATPAAREQVKAQFRAELDRMGLHHVGVDVIDRVFDAAGEEVRAQFDPVRQLVEVAMGSDSGQATDVMHHEVLHAMKNSGAFTPENWRTLEDAAWGNKELRDWVNQNYPNLSATQRMEEAVAEMYSRYRKGDWQAPKYGVLGRALQGVQRFFQALGNTLRGRGFQSAEDVMGALSRGEIQAGDVRDVTGSPMSRVLDRDKIVDNGVQAGKDAVTNVYGKGLKGLANTLAVRQFPHWFPALAEPIRGYWESNARAGVRRNEIIAKRSEVSDAYAKVKRAEMPAVAALRDDAVERQEMPFKPDPKDAGVAALYDPTSETAKQFEALSPEAQAAVRLEYSAWREDMAELVRITLDRIDRNTTMSPKDREVAKAEIENRPRKQVYFPSVRIGDLVGIATTPEYARASAAFEEARQAHADAVDKGEDTTPHEAAMADADAAKKAAYQNEGSDEYGYVRSHFENEADLQRFLKSMKEQGYKTRSTTATDEARAEPGASGSMLAHGVERAYDQALADATNELRTAKTAEDRARAQGTIDSLKGQRSMMWQLYATLTPEGSRLRSTLMRKNVAGASTDVPRAFAVMARRNAGFLSGLEYGSRAGDYLTQIKAAAEKTGDYRNMRAFDALKQHYDSLAQYADTPVVNFLKSAAYVYDLGLSPSFMAMHLAQTPLVTYPVLAARHGYGRSAAELVKAGGEVARTIRDWGAKGDLSSLAKNEGEGRMLHYLESFGTIHGNEPGSLNDAASPTGTLGKGGKLIMNAAGFLPMKTELANRLTTALAAYRMGLKDVNVQNALTEEQWKRAVDDGWKGTKQELAAARYAQEVTLDTHIDYSRENMPNLMQGGGFKQLIFQFQKYQQGMIEQMLRYGKDAFFNKDMSKEERLVAFRTLAGVVGMHGLVTGAMGLPGFGLVAFGANLYHKFLSENKHEPWDAEVAFRKFATDHLGFDMGNALSRGLFALPGVNQIVPGDVTDRLGMGDLLAPGAKIEGTDRSDLMAWLGSFVGGPAGSLLGNFAHAYTLADEGRPERAAEQLAPKVFRDLMKTYRFANEGVTTEKGAQVLRPDQLTTMDLVAQGLGFTPQTVETTQVNRAALSQAQDEFKTRKQNLTRQYALAAASNDQETMADVQSQINEFNQNRLADNESWAVLKPAALIQAIRQHAVDNARLMEGVSLKPGEQSLLQEEGIY